MGHDLQTENEAHHAWQEERLLEFVEHLTLLDWAAAEATLARFVAQLEEHMALEEERVLPLFKRVIEDEPPAGMDPVLVIKQVDGDHVILTRTLGRVRDALEQAREANTRRHLVRELDTFLLMRRVLEHHTSREQRDLYPHLDERLSEGERVAILEALRELRARYEG
jgi:iron-sulfur cluster repair protein YtfE (RIC family)